MPIFVARTWGLLSTLLAVGCASGGGICDTDELTAALAAAGPGDVVDVGSCEVPDVSVTVPTGVTLAGRGGSVLVGDGTGPMITLGEGATLRGLELRVPTGTGVLVADVGGVTLSDLTVVGPVTPDTADSVAPSPDPSVVATHGVVVTGAGTEAAPIVLEGLAVRGFALFGVLSSGSRIAMRDSEVCDGLDTGVMVAGGGADLEQVTLRGMLQGVRLVPAYAGVFADGAVIDSTDLVVDTSDNVGLLHQAVRATHANLLGQGNGQSAIWAQRVDALQITGAGTLLEDNGLAGLVIVDPAGPHEIREATIARTRLVRRATSAGAGSIDVGDGIHVVADTTDDLVIEGVTLTDNERVGALLGVAAGTVATTTLRSVTVSSGSEAYGVVAQSPTANIPSGAWDADVTRAGGAALNDVVVAEILDQLEAVAPMGLPIP